MIRPAQFADIPEIVGLCKAARERSIYCPFANVDEQRTKEVLFQMIARHDPTPKAHASYVLVSENRDKVDGVLVGYCTWLYETMDVLLATDIFWFVPEKGGPRAAQLLAKAFAGWAERAPCAVVLRHGVTDAISDPDRSAKMLDRMGMRRAGYIYERVIMP